MSALWRRRRAKGDEREGGARGDEVRGEGVGEEAGVGGDAMAWAVEAAAEAAEEEREGEGEVRYRLGTDRRLHKAADFRRVFEEGVSMADGRLVVYVCANGGRFSRLGVVAGKRLGKAVVRNRIKRRVREAFRLGQYELPGGYDYVLIPRARGELVSLAGYRKSLGALGERAVKKYERRKG